MNKSLAPWLTGALCLVFWYFISQKFGHNLVLFVIIFAFGFATQSVFSTWKFRSKDNNEIRTKRLINQQNIAPIVQKNKHFKPPKQRF